MTYGCVRIGADEFPVAQVCKVLDVSESGYYAWLKRTPSQREQANQSLKARIVAIWEQFKQCYGVPRIHAELQAQGLRVGKNRVARLMQRLGIQGKGGQKRRPRTTQADAKHPVAPNRLAQQFDAEQPATVWLTDSTYIVTDDGFLYVAGVMD